MAVCEVSEFNIRKSLQALGISLSVLHILPSGIVYQGETVGKIFCLGKGRKEEGILSPCELNKNEGRSPKLIRLAGMLGLS